MVPGLWNAMESDDHEQVKTMLNGWSKIDISVDGVSLIERAKEKGDETIIEALQVDITFPYWQTRHLQNFAFNNTLF